MPLFRSPVGASYILMIAVILGGCGGKQADRSTEPPTPQQVCDEAMALLNAGRQSDAELLLRQYAPVYQYHQRLIFLQAALHRSRFSIRRSAPIFRAVVDSDAESPAGRCAALVLQLDAHRHVEKNFTALQRLVEQHPEDIIVRWMLAVQCRAYDRNEEGVRQYQKILEKWNPGPSLVHQTYGNVLHELKRYEEALAERKITVQMDPAGWSYQGLGNTLTAMDRFDEANQAYEKSVGLAPNRANYWDSWAWGLTRARRLPEAIEKCKKAVGLNPKKYQSWSRWGYCLEMMDDKKGAVKKYQAALAINPDYRYAKDRLAGLLHELGRHEEERAIKNRK